MYFVKHGGLTRAGHQPGQKGPGPHDIDVVTGPSGPPTEKVPEPEDDTEAGGWKDGFMN